MPDRTDPPQTPPLSVTVGVPASGPGDVDRRASSQASVNPQPTTQVIVPGQTSEEPAWQREWPKWAKLLYHLGPFSIICGAMIVGGGCFMRERATDRANDRADRMEEREIRRAEAAQYQRQNDVVAAKFDALVAKIDAAMERGQSTLAEMRLGRAAFDRVAQRLEDALQRLFSELKRLVPAKSPGSEPDPAGFVNPILWLTDHAPPTAMPTPGGAR